MGQTVNAEYYLTVPIKRSVEIKTTKESIDKCSVFAYNAG